MAGAVRRSTQLGLAAALCVGAGAAYAQKQNTAAAVPAPGVPTRVHVVTEILLKDSKQKRELPVKVYAPEPAGKYPVIVFSHGAGGSKDSFGPLSRSWASRGYVVIHPSHADTMAKAGGTAPGGFGSAIQGMLKNPTLWEKRARDVSFVLDSLDTIERSSGVLKGKLDESRVGVAGHSFGAYTAMLVGGATVDFPDGAKDRSFADRRVRAVLVISGQGTGQQGLTEHSWKKMALPMMTMTGSKDRGAGGQGPEWKKQPYDFSPAGDKYHVFIEGASHFSFGGELAGGGLTASALGPGVRQKLEGGRRVGFGPGGAAGEQAEVFSTVKTATINFWNAYLKQEPQARVYLASDQLAAQTKGRVRVSHR